MTGRETQKKTNPTGGKGKGRGGRKTFIDEIVSKAKSSQRLIPRRPKPQRSPQSDYKTEEVVSPENIEETTTSVEELVESVEEPLESVEEPAKNVEEPATDLKN